jgi:hypothetical protein
MMAVLLLCSIVYIGRVWRVGFTGTEAIRISNQTERPHGEFPCPTCRLFRRWRRFFLRVPFFAIVIQDRPRLLSHSFADHSWSHNLTLCWKCRYVNDECHDGGWVKSTSVSNISIRGGWVVNSTFCTSEECICPIFSFISPFKFLNTIGCIHIPVYSMHATCLVNLNLLVVYHPFSNEEEQRSLKNSFFLHFSVIMTIYTYCQCPRKVCRLISSSMETIYSNE